MFLFKGWTPAFIRMAPNTILLFVFFEVRLLYCLFDPLLLIIRIAAIEESIYHYNLIRKLDILAYLDCI